MNSRCDEVTCMSIGAESIFNGTIGLVQLFGLVQRDMNLD